MLKSIFLLITVVILFSGCHRFHPIAQAAIVVPAVIISPFIYKPYHRGYYNNQRGHRGYSRGRRH